MASVRKHGKGWQVRVRRKGWPDHTKNFRTKKKAEDYGDLVEADMIRGIFVDRSEAEQTTLAEALDRYLRDVTRKKRGAAQETSLIRRLQKHPLAKRSLASLRSPDFVEYRDTRESEVSGTTVRLELALISHLFTIAKEEWGLPLTNPISSVKRPKASKGRKRRLEEGEEERLLSACRQSSARPWLEAAVRLAIETGMRAGELLTTDWAQVRLPRRRVIELEITKNGDDREVPLSRKAVEILQRLPRSIGGRVIGAFGGRTDRLDHAFARACKLADIEGLRFHDLRHEAASRFAPHFQAQELAKIMGWKTLQMAMRYYKSRPEEFLARLDAIL